MLSPDSRTIAFELIRAPSGYRLDFAVLTAYTLDLEALLVLPLSVVAHPDGGLEDLLADPLLLHQAIRDAGDRVHAFVDEKGIAIPRGARSLYSMLESSVHAVRAPNRGAFHPKVWVARFTAADEGAADLMRVAILSRNLTFDRSWDVALASEASLRTRRRAATSRPLGDFLSELPQLAASPVPQDVAERVQALADQAARAEFPAPDGFDSPIEFHSLGLSRRRRPWSPPTSGYRTLAVAPFVNRTGLDAVSRLSAKDRTLVSRQEALDKLPEDALAEWDEVFVLSEDAQGEPEDGGAETEDGGADHDGPGDPGTRPSGLHAKMIAVEHGWDVTWYVGSANLTAAAFTGRNVEMMASVTGRKGRRGGVTGHGIHRFLEGGFQKLCAPYQRTEPELFSVNYFCRLAPTIFAGSGRRESRSTTMTPVGRVGVACDVQSGVENALPRRCTVAPLLARVFHAAGAVHRLLGFRSIPAFRRSTVGGRGAAADPEHVPGEQAPRGISGGTGPCGSSGRRTQACSA